ncbi:MAG: ABC transporter substrate-binding protein [Acidovorax sp.]|nr:MAG: ABC transporter substrate-binding protein [Acidovorax sp.]
MATRQVLAELTAGFEQATGHRASIEAVGGVDAAQRVMAGESFDVVVLAADAIAKLLAAGCIVPGSVVDLVHSGVAVAVPAGAPQPDIGSEDAVRQAVLAARSISYSTGPSGVALAKLFERWGIAGEIAGRMVQAPPVGPLPPAIQITTTFSAGIGALSQQADAARELLAYMASPQAADAKRKQGMDPA